MSRPSTRSGASWRASPSGRTPRRSELTSVGRRELLKWVNRVCGVEYVRVEDVADGVAFAQLIDAAYPDARVPLYRLDFATRHEFDRARNLEIVRATLDRMDLDLKLDVGEVSRSTYRACDETLRHLFVMIKKELPVNALQGYDGRAVRLQALEKRRYLARAPSKAPGWVSSASWEQNNNYARNDINANVERQAEQAPSSPFLRDDQYNQYDSDDSSDGDLPGPDAFMRSATAQRTWDATIDKQKDTCVLTEPKREKRNDSRRFESPTQTSAPRPATAPPNRSRSIHESHRKSSNRKSSSRMSIESISSARVDIIPENIVEVGLETPDVKLLGVQFGNENYETPSTGSDFELFNSSSCARRVPFRSLDRWAEKARWKLARIRNSGDSVTPHSLSPLRKEVSWSDTDFRGSVADRSPVSNRTRLSWNENDTTETNILSLEGLHLEATPAETIPVETAETRNDASSCSSSDSEWTSSPSGSAERVRRLEKAERIAKRERRFLQSGNLSFGAARVSQEAEKAFEKSHFAEKAKRASDADKTQKRLIQTQHLKLEVREIKLREEQRRRLKEEARVERLEQQALRRKEREDAARVEADLLRAKEEEEQARLEQEIYAQEVKSARQQVRLEEARAHRLERRKQVRNALRIDAEGLRERDEDETRTSVSKKKADLQSLAEYLKWELAKELKQFELDKVETAALLKQRDQAILALGEVETKRRIAQYESSLLN